MGSAAFASNDSIKRQQSYSALSGRLYIYIYIYNARSPTQPTLVLFNRACRPAIIDRATILEPRHLVKSLQIVWISGVIP